MIESLTTTLIAGILMLMSIFFLILAIKKFNIAILCIVLAPWVTALFVPNSLDAASDNNLTYGSFFRIGILILSGVAGLIKFLQSLKDNANNTSPFLRLFAIFTIVAFVSVLFSIDRSNTILRAIELLMFFCFLLGVYFWMTDQEKVSIILNQVFWVVAVIAILNFFSLLLFKDRVWWVVQQNRFIGLWGHPNMMGSFCMVFYPLLFWKFTQSDIRQKGFVFILLILVFLMHFLSGSRSSLFVAVFGVCCWFLVLKQNFKLVAILSFLSLAAFFINAFRPGEIGQSFIREGESNHSITSLTGRNTIWNTFFDLIKQKPLTGYGYQTNRSLFEGGGAHIPQEILWAAGSRFNLHNGYLEMFLNLGFIGFSLWCLILLLPFFKSLSLESNVAKAYVVTIFSMSLLVNFVESSINIAKGPVGVFFWFSWIIASRLIQTKKERLLHENISEQHE